MPCMSCPHLHFQRAFLQILILLLRQILSLSQLQSVQSRYHSDSYTKKRNVLLEIQITQTVQHVQSTGNYLRLLLTRWILWKLFSAVEKLSVSFSTCTFLWCCINEKLQLRIDHKRRLKCVAKMFIYEYMITIIVTRVFCLSRPCSRKIFRAPFGHLTMTSRSPSPPGWWPELIN